MVIVSHSTHGMVALSYVVAMLAMIFTAYGYGRMAAAYPIAGSSYSYAQRAINPHIGFLSGWAILMDYMLIPMINFLLSSIFMAHYFPGVPGWVWIVSLILIVTIINYYGITVTAWANNTLIIIQLIFVTAFALFAVNWLLTGNGAATFFDWSAFCNSAELNQPGVGWVAILGGASILALSFLGFDAVTTVAEEAINPEKNIGKAITFICLGAGIMFIVVSYLMQLSWPLGWKEFNVVDRGAQELVIMIAGNSMGYFFIASYIVAGLASAMVSQASASRILFGMGRDGALPKRFFGYIHPKHKTPTFNIFLIGVISLAALFLNLETAVSLINFGALAGFILVNLSVIAHYYIKQKKRDGFDFVRYLVVPVIGATICFIIWLNLDIHSKLLGFAWLFVGIIYLALTTNFFRKLPPEMKLEDQQSEEEPQVTLEAAG